MPTHPLRLVPTDHPSSWPEARAQADNVAKLKHPESKRRQVVPLCETLKREVKEGFNG
ncbi:MAG: hypothetical protein PHE55_20800 [Methylococcaceae bacterium]|nr:hypothetical protein [Methylococcaceae bacterium]